jgi:hypothetical protein
MGQISFCLQGRQKARIVGDSERIEADGMKGRRRGADSFQIRTRPLPRKLKARPQCDAIAKLFVESQPPSRTRMESLQQIFLYGQALGLERSELAQRCAEARCSLRERDFFNVRVLFGRLEIDKAIRGRDSDCLADAPYVLHYLC